MRKAPHRTRARRRPVSPAPPPTRPPPLSVVILAAGEGKRMKSAIPKVLQPLAGRALLKHVIDTARSLDPAAIHVVYGHGGERVREELAAEPVSWTLQEPRLGTGHAVLQAMPKIPDGHVVLVLYGDVPLIRRATLEGMLGEGAVARVSLLTMLTDNPAGYGRIVRSSSGGVRRIVEEKDASGGELRIRECNTGVMALPSTRLRAWLQRVRADNSQREYYLTDVIALAVKDRVPVKAVTAPSAIEVQGVNDKAQLAEVETAYQREAVRALMLAGVTVADPARLDLRGTVSHGTDVSLDVNVVLEGRVVLGDGVRIGPGCVLRDAELGAGTLVLAHCVIDGAVIGPECIIGPFARIRPQTTLGRGVHIGNFVEVKNARLGEGSKANHLAYVGDADLGARVNIGAGTIIANYDGANKHRTLIGDDVHTGSNSVLVAPISVGPGATVGAGSTVTRTVPAGKLTVARARQATIEGWRRPTKNKS